MLRLYHALVAGAAIAVGAGAAGAEERPPSFIGGAATSLEDARLVGRGGEVYARDPAGVWRRRAGGVAVELVAAWGRSPKEQLAVGPRAPVFRHDGETWTTIAGLRGRATLSVRDAPRAGLAIGAKLFVLAGATWSALPGAPAWVSALWTGAPGQALILVEGDLYRQVPGKRPWQKVTLAEHPAALGGAEPLVLGVGGGVWKIARGRARKLAAPDGFRARQIFGAVVEGDGALARVDGDALRPVGAPPTDDLALLIDLGAGGKWLAATRGGRVFTGAPGKWTEEKVDPAPPTTAPPTPGAQPSPIAPPVSR